MQTDRRILGLAPTRFARSAVVPLMLAMLALTNVGGCAALAWTVTAFAPKPKQEALYTLPNQGRTIVFPDDPVYKLSYPPLKRLLADSLNAEMEAHDVGGELVPYTQLTDLEATEPRFAAMPLDRICAKVGADRAVFLDIREFRLRDNPADPLWQGRLRVMVRVVSVDGTRLWPTDVREGHEVIAERPREVHDSDSYGLQLTRSMVDEMADKVAKLFYDHRLTE